MIFSKRSITYSTFLLLNVNHVAAKTIRKLGNTRGSQYIDDTNQAKTEEWADFDARQLQLSMPSTPGPTPRPTRRPTSRPNSEPTVPPAPTTKAPTPQPTPQPTTPPTPQPIPQPTPPPTNAAVPTIPALFLDEDDLFDEFGLSECQGDCDDDSDCEFGLICFFRDVGTVSVPGCQGNADETGDGFDDFCIKPPTDNTLVLVGDEDLPASAFPLGKCQGDCDTDDDCAGSLACFERAGDEVVNGCIGFGGTTWDYCYDPNTSEVTLDWIGDPEEEWDYFQLQQCQGDCDFDSDCANGLVCFQRDFGDEGEVPGCLGTANDLGSGSDDFCVPRPSGNYLASVFDDLEGANVGIYPIGFCQGDCDLDEDCATGLACYQRESFNEVPGCVGSGEQDYDYCI